MWLKSLLCILVFHSCGAVIYSLNKSEYYRMPGLYHLDAYEKCLHDNDASGVYCYTHFNLVTEEPSDLMRMIQEYSARTETHPNHTRLAYGICLTNTCKDFYTSYKSEDHKAILEACLNDTLWRHYKLKAKVIDDQLSCTTAKDVSTYYKIDILDGIVAVLFLSILGFNVVECLREIYFGTDKCPQGKDFLSCFSIPQNWARLTSHAEGPDPRLTRLKFMQGFKCLMTIPVLIAHSCLKLFLASDDFSGIDTLYLNNPFTQIMEQGGLSMQAFFAVAGFLLAYNFEITAEKKKLSPAWIPVAIAHRWLKLFIPLVVVVAFYSTWIQHLGSGPLWQATIVKETQACRQYWWKNLLFINNYIDQPSGQLECIVTSWYLVTDFQLYILGVCLLILTTGLRRKVLLGVLTVAGLIAVAAHTYYQDLDGTFFFSPEVARTLWFQDVSDPAFNHVYKRAHTNVAAYLVGMASGLAAFHLAKSGFNIEKYSLLKHPYVGLLGMVLMPFVVMSYTYMYPEAPRPSVFVRTAYAVLARVALLGITAVFLISMMLKEKDIGRDFLCWQGWAVPSRVALSAYLVHFAIIKLMAASLTSLTTLKFAHGLLDACGMLSFIFVGAIFFHLLVEAPLSQLVKMYILPTTTKEAHALKGDDRVKGENNGDSRKEKGKSAKNIDVPKGEKPIRKRLSRKSGD